MERNIANFSVLNVYAYGLAKLGAKASAGTSMIKIRDKMTRKTELMGESSHNVAHQHKMCPIYITPNISNYQYNNFIYTNTQQSHV